MNLPELIEQLGEFDAPLLANTIGYIDPSPAHTFYMGGSIRDITQFATSTVGLAVTCIMDTSSPEGADDMDGFSRQLESIAALGAPAVWVVKAAGSRPDHECVMGDGMARLLYTAGCRGIVTDGGVRDVAGLLTIPFAAYARGRTVHHCAMRVLATDIPIEVGGITIRPGDMVHASADGVIRIPETCLDGLPARARDMRALEQEAFGLFRQRGLSSTARDEAVGKLLEKYRFKLPRE